MMRALLIVVAALATISAARAQMHTPAGEPTVTNLKTKRVIAAAKSFGPSSGSLWPNVEGGKTWWTPTPVKTFHVTVSGGRFGGPSRQELAR